MLSKLSKLARRPTINGINSLSNLKLQKRNFSISSTIGLSVLGFLGLSTSYVATLYKVAKPGEFICRTGIFIPDIDISKKAFHLPYQTLTRLSLEPITYQCVIEEGMSVERISFNLPVIFTIGPAATNPEALKIYARLLQQSSPEDLKSKIIGIIQGETRTHAGKIPLDDLFNNREKFKVTITDNINMQLADFGLFVYNANIEELRDMKGNEYFVFLRKKALEAAINNAKIAVAEQNKFGNIGEKQHVTETRQKIAHFEKEAKITENERDRDISESNTSLSVAKAEFEKLKHIAENESKAAAEINQLKLQKEVEEHRSKQELERLRAQEMTAANVKAEVIIRESEGKATACVREAQGKADALRIEAEAKSYSEIKLAEATAQAIRMKAEAEALGLTKLIESAGNVGNLSQYLMLQANMPTKIAEQQARAIRGMRPKINVWQTGKKEDGIQNLSGTINDLVQNAVPLLDGIKQQYGIDFLKNWKDSKN